MDRNRAALEITGNTTGGPVDAIFGGAGRD